MFMIYFLIANVIMKRGMSGSELLIKSNVFALKVYFYLRINEIK